MVYLYSGARKLILRFDFYFTYSIYNYPVKTERTIETYTSDFSLPDVYMAHLVCCDIVHEFTISSTGKERDAETGYGYFGARYYDAELMTGWLSVDPMADKYPGISPYAYCAWTRPTGGDEHRWIKYNIVNNPVKLVDPDGEEMFPTEADAAKVRAKAVKLFGESRVGEIFNKGDAEQPNYAFHVFGYGKDKSEKPITNESGVWAYKPDKCVDSKFDLFMYSIFKADKEWSLNSSITFGAEAKVQLGTVGAGINLSNVDLVGVDWNWSDRNIEFYHCEDNNTRGSRGVYLGGITITGQSYRGGDYIDGNTLQTNILGAGHGKNEGKWNLQIGASCFIGIQVSFNSKLKK